MTHIVRIIYTMTLFVKEAAMRLAYRQGDVLIIEGQVPPEANALKNCVLARGEATGHVHQITSGEAILYVLNGKLYLRIGDMGATLTHEEHNPISLPKGEYEVAVQQTYRSTMGWMRNCD